MIVGWHSVDSRLIVCWKVRSTMKITVFEQKRTALALILWGWILDDSCKATPWNKSLQSTVPQDQQILTSRPLVAMVTRLYTRLPLGAKKSGLPRLANSASQGVSTWVREASTDVRRRPTCTILTKFLYVRALNRLGFCQFFAISKPQIAFCVWAFCMSHISWQHLEPNSSRERTS